MAKIQLNPHEIAHAERYGASMASIFSQEAASVLIGTIKNTESDIGVDEVIAAVTKFFWGVHARRAAVSNRVMRKKFTDSLRKELLHALQNNY